ncbi:hypothetical protein GCM10020001_025010 [Nonomuraea salmonea]
MSGIGATLAESIVRHRDANGPFRTRSALKSVPRLGPKAFEQCAGFLRIRGGDDPLDVSAVHPESYPVVRRILTSAKTDLKSLIGNTAALRSLDPRAFTDDTFGLPTVTDILRELEKPGRDPRPAFKTATFKEGVEKLSDLTAGMILEGVVTNVAAFGAFVDVGVHQDGLVHVSAMSRTFVSDPRDVVKPGDIVRVKVLGVDIPRKRISLTLRLEDETTQEGTDTPRRGAGRQGSRDGSRGEGGRGDGSRGAGGRGEGGRGNGGRGDNGRGDNGRGDSGRGEGGRGDGGRGQGPRGEGGRGDGGRGQGGQGGQGGRGQGGNGGGRGRGDGGRGGQRRQDRPAPTGAMAEALRKAGLGGDSR